jgi:hypothetical protein
VSQPAAESEPPVGADGLTDDEYFRHFDKLVEGFVRQRQTETPLTKPRDTRRAAESTFRAVAYVLRTYGMSRLHDPWTVVRLQEFSKEQITELIAALGRMQGRFPAITDQLIVEIGKLGEQT